MSWQEAELGHYFTLKHGYAFKGRYFSNSGEYILLTPGNCHEKGGLRLKGEKEKYYIGDIPENFVLSSGDLIVVMTDLVQNAPILGGAFFIPEDERYLHNQRLGLVNIIDESIVDKKFLYYLLNYEPYRAQVRSSATGTTVRHTAPQRIYRCRVKMPDFDTQTRIADILSTYDDIIENNRQRIALLEQAARLLYREWFVYLRFPGHEHVKIVDGVPEGWKRVPLGELLTLQRGFDLPAKQRKYGIVPVVASTGICGFHEVVKVNGPGVVTGRSGSLGTVLYIQDDFWPLNTTLWVKEFKRVSPLFAYFLLNNSTLEQFNGGAAVPTLDRKNVHRLLTTCPTRELIGAFTEYVTPVYAQIKMLHLLINNLARARDLLLPRLMNGEITI